LFAVVLVFGCQAHGPAEVDWTEKVVSFSEYPLSSTVAIGRTVAALEEKLGLL